MTLPCERYNAVKRTEEFLKDLMDPKKTPRVPKKVREQAYYCLRHYPGSYYLDTLATQCPHILETPNPVDDLSMLMNKYEQRKLNGQSN
jgi:hypothetical protein